MRQRPFPSRGRRAGLAVALATIAVVALAGAAAPTARERAAAAPDAVARSPAVSFESRLRAPERRAVRPAELARVRRGRAILCTLPRQAETLPAGALRGLAHHLRQYPSPALATGAERRAARALLTRLRAASARWRDPRVAAADGFATRTAPRRPGDRTAHYLHAEHRRYSNDDRFLDPARPESLIYANTPGRPLVLVGVMYSVPRGVHGPSPGGPLTRWHSHLVCARGDRRGLKPRADGTCPPGARLRQGSEMLHVWFTGDLRSSYAIHAPQPELCRVGLLPTEACEGSIGPAM